MKKIIAVVSLVGFAAVLAAQEPPTKQLSIQDANQLNGTPKEPTINGKPYSQYKAEQEALKKQQPAKPAAHMANIPKGLSITPNTESADPALERMNEQAKHGMPQTEDKRTLPPVTTTETEEPKQPVTTPEVPSQFRLPATAQSWTGRVAESKQVNQEGDPAQPVDAKISAVYQPAATAKPASTQKAGQEGGAGKPTPVIEASVVKTPARDAASSTAPPLPADLNVPAVSNGTSSNVPATVPANNNPVAPGSVMGTPAEQNKTATEKPAKQH